MANFLSRNALLIAAFFHLYQLSPAKCLKSSSSTRTLVADGGELTDEDKQQLLDFHNELRSVTALGGTGSQPAATDMVKLVWDDDLAAGAKEWADACVFEHDSGFFGENLFASASSADNVDNIEELISGVQNWYDEHENYTYDSNSCSGVCGHYTQVVWAMSEKLGCGYAECTGEIFGFAYEVFLVCRYDPPGNFVGQAPYREASSASDIATNCPSSYEADTNSGLCEVEGGDNDETEDDNDETEDSDDEDNENDEDDEDDEDDNDETEDDNDETEENDDEDDEDDEEENILTTILCRMRSYF